MKLSFLVFRNAGIMAALAVLQRLSGLVSIFILARMLDSRGLGAYAFTQSTSQTFFGLTRLGADAGLHVHLAREDVGTDLDKIQDLISTALVFFLGGGLVSGFCLFMFSDLIAVQVFSAAELEPYVAASAVLLMAQFVSQYCYIILAGLHKFGVYAQIISLTTPLAAGATIIAAYLAGVSGAIWAAAYASLAAALVLGWRLRRLLRRLGLGLRPQFRITAARNMFSSGFPFYIGGLLVIPADFLCIGYLSSTNGVDALGDLRVVQSLLSAATVLPTAIAGPLVSHLSAQEHGKGMSETLLNQIRVVSVLALCISIPFCAVWNEVVGLIYGSGFHMAASVGAVALISFPLMILTSVLSGGFLASGRSIGLIVVSFAQLSCIVLFAKPFISWMGLQGYLWLQVAFWSVGVFASLLLLQRQLRENLLRRWMLPLAVVAALAAGLAVADTWWAAPFPVRVMGGACLLGILLLACRYIVFSKDEAQAVATEISASILRIRARFRRAPATVKPK